MSDAEMITILVLFHSNTFRNFKHFYLFYVCRELKEESLTFFRMYVVKQKCTTANVVIYSDISLFYYQKFFC